MIAALTERVGIVRILEHLGVRGATDEASARRAVIGGDKKEGRLDTASDVLDGQGRGVSDDSESGVDGALESVKAASRELLPTLARAGTAGNGQGGVLKDA